MFLSVHFSLEQIYFPNVPSKHFIIKLPYNAHSDWLFKPIRARVIWKLYYKMF